MTYLLVDELTDEIVGSCETDTRQDGCRTVKISEGELYVSDGEDEEGKPKMKKASISGDNIPSKEKFMTRGKLTKNNEFTAPEEIPEDPIVSAFKALDPSTITDPAVKLLVQLLQR